MSVDEYDNKFIRLSYYAPHLVPDEREKIQRFILGLRRPLYQLVGPKKETYPTYSTMADSARMMMSPRRRGSKGLRKTL